MTLVSAALLRSCLGSRLLFHHLPDLCGTVVVAYCGFAVNLSFCSTFARSFSGVNRCGSSAAIKQTDATNLVLELWSEGTPSVDVES